MKNNSGRQKEASPLSFRTTRRRVLRSGGATAGAALFGVGAVQGGGSKAKVDAEASIEATTVTVSEGTNIAPTIAPDGETIMFDLHGILFSLSREGGEAEQLTEVELEPARPDYGPDGTHITFQGYADGNYDIWTAGSDGSDIQQLTGGFWDDREPKWSPDGSRIAFSSDRGGDGYNVWTVDVASGDLQQWTDSATENYEPTCLPMGRRSRMSLPWANTPMILATPSRK